ncbi:MCM DNA helicase complex subunit mcm6, partial [Coemansia guatemalensis]
MARAARRAYQKARRGVQPDEGAEHGGAPGVPEGVAIAVAVFGLPAPQRVRELRADKIGTLASVGGTVTRTSEVRPELIRGVFRCGACSAVSGAVAQQFKYTEPSICENALCQNRTAWTLVVEQSAFADWQRVRVQEHAAEIPPGSMPRTLDVVVRGDLVERVKPGDRALFTGALVALPDVAQLAGPGQTAEAQRDSGRAQGGGGGVTGVQALGVRELTYRLAFIACHAQAAGAEAETDAAGDAGDARDAFLASLTRAEREELAAMGAGGDVYARLAASVAPTVFGHDEVKRGILLQLLGGVHKRTREGMRLRGDINVCVVGDPSTAKS